MAKDSYIVERALLDITVSAMAAGATIESPVTGTRTVGLSTLAVTGSTITATSLQRSQVADALHVYVIPPVAADGTFPDAEIWFVADGVDLRNYLILDCHIDALMAPWPHNVAGGPVDGLGKPLAFTLGRSKRSVLWDAKNGKPTANMALVCTGIPYVNQLTVMVRSIAGWVAGALTNMRIIVTGEVLTADHLRAFSDAYNGQVYLQHLQRAMDGKSPLSFFHDIGGPVSFDTWAAMSGGPKQKGRQVHRYAKWSTNVVATPASAFYPTTNQSDLRGGSTNAGPAAANADSDHDLGINGQKTGDALWVERFGVRVNPAAATAPNWAYAGWQIEGDVIPSENGNVGLVARTRVNPFQYGSVQPTRGDSNLYTLVPRYPGELLIHGEGAVPGIAANGTAVAAGVAKIAVVGTYVKSSA